MPYKEDVEFVLSEVSRISQMGTKEALKMPFPENMAMLPHPSGYGSILCGMKAYHRLQSISELAVSRSQYAGRIRSDLVFDHLKSIIVKRFLSEERQVSTKEVDRAVSSALKAASNKIVNLTHYIPCHLGHEKSPEIFSIGPVTFKQSDDVFKELTPAFQSYLALEKGNEDIKKTILDDTSAYYKTFGWIAKVKIDNCDPLTSRKLASRIIQNSIDCLHLVLGADYSHHMRMSGPNFSTDKRGHIAVNSIGGAEISTSVDWLSHPLGDGWWEKINSDDGHYFINLMGIAITSGNEIPDPTPLAQRFLDGLAWYGEAVRDPFQASRLVKYVTAMERILTTKNEENLVEVFSRRGAALVCSPEEDNLDKLQKRFKEIYDLRSCLVHGSRSPHESGLGKSLRKAEELTRDVLFRSLEFYEENGLKKKDVSIKRLDENYDKLVEMRLGLPKNDILSSDIPANN